MLWSDIRKIYPNQWLVIEALEAHTTPNNQRELDKIAVIDVCSDGSAAMTRYRSLHSQFPGREFYFVNTSREALDIRERQWVGIRRNTKIDINPSASDVLHTIRGVGGTELVYLRKVDFLTVGGRSIPNFELEIGGMDYGFEINGILGMDFLTASGAMINLRDMQVNFLE
jgi:hypothetical protein